MVGNDAFINSPTDLKVTDFTSVGGDVTLTVDATTQVGIIRARQAR